MKNIMSILLATIVAVSGLGTVVHAETTDSTTKNEEKAPFENAVLLDTQTDEESGVTVELYGLPDDEDTNIPTMSELSSNISPLAGDGKWNIVGQENWIMNGDINDIRIDGVYSSTGGDYSLVIEPHKANHINGRNPYVNIELWEDDPVNDDYVTDYFLGGVVSFPNYHIKFTNLNKYVDGANKRAEFYTKHATNYSVSGSKVLVKYFD